jgi:aspartyl protease family protein
MKTTHNSAHHKQNPNSFIGKGMIYAAWVMALLMLTWLFNNYLGRQHNPNQIVTSQLHNNGVHEVILKQNRQGHYIANGLINHQQVTFLLDTGATVISIPAHLAKALSLPLGAKQRVKTANGETIVYSTQLNSVRLGNIELHNLKASIAPQMTGDQVLLGMNFMKQIEMVQRNNQLTLRQN